MVEAMNTIIGVPLGYLMWLCYVLIKNYGLAIVFFTLLTKVILFPLNIWVQKNSIKMVKLQPAINEIAAKYAGNRDKASEEQLALYKREKYKPLAGVIPMLIQIPIILGLISVVYHPLQHLLHLDPALISAFVDQAAALSPGMDLGSGAHLRVIELIQDPATVNAFASLQVSGVDVAGAIAQIQGMDLMFLGLDMSHTPGLHLDIYLLVPVLSGLSALLLCVLQNRENVLQREQGFLGRWGMAAFLTAFSTYFAFLVPAGVGLYWIFGNLFAIATLYLLNWMYDPRKEIDYAALALSKEHLTQARELEKSLKPTREQQEQAKADYKRFCKELEPKQLVFYSEKSGFYKYFEGIIDQLLRRSDVVMHYITSDPKDAIFEKKSERLQPYYIDDNRLIPLFMKIDADMMIMTTPNLQTYHLKRSLVRKDVEYVFTPHDPLSVHMGFATGALDHFDTVLCVGEHQVREIRQTEQAYGLPEKNLVPCGYSLIDNLLAAYDAMDKADNPIPKILIAPSWQEGNILESCIDGLLESLLDQGYDITVRPHPEFVKRQAARMQEIVSRYQDRFDEHFGIETDFSSNVTIFTADLVVTDWSGIAFEFSYATKKPCLFIDTPMKVMNPEYQRIASVPIEISLRQQLGASLEPDQMDRAAQTVRSLLDQGETYRARIQTAMDQYLFNPGHCAEKAADYILDSLAKKHVK